MNVGWQDRVRYGYYYLNDPGPVGHTARFLARAAILDTGAKMFTTFSGFRVRGGNPYTRYKKEMPPTSRHSPAERSRSLSPRSRQAARNLINMEIDAPPTPDGTPITLMPSGDVIMQDVYSNPFSIQKKDMGSQSGAVASRNAYKFGNTTFSKTLAQTYGSGYSYENGALAGSTTTKVLFIQIGTPIYQQINSVFRAMLIALLHKHGLHFKTWDVVTNVSGQIVLNYRNKVTGTIGSVSHTFVGLESWAQVAGAWANAFVAGIETAGFGGLNEYDFFRIQLRFLTGTNPNSYTDVAILYTEMLDINVHQSYTIKCQNQTAADTAASISTEVLNVNPVQVKTYYINGQHAVLNVEDYGATPAGTTSFIPNTTIGYFNYATTDTTGPSVMKKIPQSNVFERVVKTVPQISLTPGHIVQRSVSKTFKMSLNHWFSGLADMGVTTVGLSDSVVSTEYGCNMVLAFEKTLNTRGPEEVGINIGAQWTVFMSSFITSKLLQPTNLLVTDV